MAKLSRSLEQYTDIEHYKEYEILQCITFETVIRTDKFKQRIQKIIDYFHPYQYELYDFTEEKRCQIVNNVYTMIKDLGILDEKGHVNRNYALDSMFFYMLDKVEAMPYYLSNNKECIHRHREKSVPFSDEYPDIRFVINKENNLAITTLSQKDGFHILNETNTKFYKEPSRDLDNYNLKELGKFILTKQNTLSHQTTIIQKFSRPRLCEHALFKRNISLDLNLYTSREAFLSYVGHIYDTLIPKVLTPSPLEEITNDLPKFFEHYKNLGIAKELSKVLLNPKKAADTFFIYDAYAEGYDTKSIQHEIENYRLNSKLDYYEAEIAPQTIKSYYEYAKEYINEWSCEELIMNRKK